MNLSGTVLKGVTVFWILLEKAAEESLPCQRPGTRRFVGGKRNTGIRQK